MDRERQKFYWFLELPQAKAKQLKMTHLGMITYVFLFSKICIILSSAHGLPEALFTFP